LPYPAIDKVNAQNVVESLKIAIDDGQDPMTACMESAVSAVVQKSGPDYPRPTVEKASEQMRRDLLPGCSNNALMSYSKGSKGAAIQLEAEMAGRLHSSLCQIDVAILQDEDFWRYLSLFPFRWYLLAREPEMQPQDFGGTAPKLDESGEVVRFGKTNLKTQLLLRTYLWGKCALDENSSTPWSPYSRATSIGPDGPSVTDIWHSHIIRVQLGQMTEAAHAFVDVSAEAPLTTSESRQLEKLLTRMKHNVLLDHYDYAGARKLVEEQADLAKRLLNESSLESD